MKRFKMLAENIDSLLNKKVKTIDESFYTGDAVSNLAAMKVLIALALSVLKRMRGSDLFKFNKLLSDMNNMMDDEIDKMDNQQEREFNSMYMKRIRRVKSMIFESLNMKFEDDEASDDIDLLEEGLSPEITNGMKMSGNASRSLMKALGRITELKVGGYIGVDGWGTSGFFLMKDGNRYPVQMVVQYNEAGKNEGGYLVAFEVQTPISPKGGPDFDFMSDLDDAIAQISEKIPKSIYIADRWSKLYVQIPKGQDPSGVVDRIVKEFPTRLAKYMKESQ